MSEPKGKRDVRMRGFAQRSTVDDAIAWIDGATAPLDGQQVTLSEAHRRVLASDVIATMSVPPFARSAMDGYAVRAAETTGASDYAPLTFALCGKSMPGEPFGGSVGSGEAVRIMTGAPIPSGATAVVPVEYAAEESGTVAITVPVAEGRHIGRVGEDIAEGAVVLECGRRLRPQDVGVVASLGLDQVTVVRRPRVRIVTTGNELAEPGSTRQPNQIFDANTSILRGLVARDGAELESAVRVEDSDAAITRALTTGNADVVLVGGGSSVGAEDFAPQVLAREGELPIHGVAMRPSSPSGMGRIGSTLVFLLPGNPVSCLCAYDFFAGRAIRVLGGQAADWPYLSRPIQLARKIVSQIGRVDYCRVRVTEAGCEPIAISGASILSSTTRADGFVVVPASSEGWPDGATVTVFHYSEPGR